MKHEASTCKRALISTCLSDRLTMKLRGAMFIYAQNPTAQYSCTHRTGALAPPLDAPDDNVNMNAATRVNQTNNALHMKEQR